MGTPQVDHAARRAANSVASSASATTNGTWRMPPAAWAPRAWRRLRRSGCRAGRR
ncbi:hypothetical protein AB5I41_08210 [Sphingomonas sp. MMS24-JH45]